MPQSVRDRITNLMQLVAEGKTNAEIGVVYGVSPTRAKQMLTWAYGILDCKSTNVAGRRAEAVSIAYKRGYLQ